jgi:hypothetical protein
MAHELTRKQELFLCKLIDFIAENGKAPTIREAQTLGGFSSSRTAAQYIEQLTEAHYLERTKGSRGLRVLSDPRDARPARKRSGRQRAASPERDRRPIGALLATASDLDDWATRRESQAMLPQLVRKLVFATTERGGRVEFAAGEGVQSPGWDGLTDFVVRTAFVPAGLAGWELGTGGDPNAKANDDYRARTKAPLELTPSKSTFVFVTLRRWREKRDWAAAKRAEKVWKDVVALDADDLEAWLENAPAVHAWLSAHIGKRPEGAVDLSSYAANWLEATVPALSADFVLAGREEAATAVRSWLFDGAGSIALQAETRDEGIVFFASVLQQLPPDEREQIEVRAVVVSTERAWEQLTLSRDPLILIPLIAPTSIASAERNGHRVVLPLTPTETSARKPVAVGPIDRKKAAPVLEKLGLKEQDAATLAALARRSMMAFRRQRGTTPELLRPRWAAAEHARILVLAMLIGAWDDDEKKGDREIVSRISDMPYGTFVAQLRPWSTETDPPVRNIGDKWLIVSKEDSWPLLHRYLTRDDLRRFHDATIDVLTTPDPRLDLPRDEQWMANAFGHSPRYSHTLTESLADTLALLGVRGDDTRATAESGQAVASAVVRQVLEKGNADHRIWASLSGVLALLAEAAPERFLEGVEGGLRGQEPVLKHLFTDAPGMTSFTASSPHPGLLWALERLAWAPEHLARAAKALARLSILDDPRGTLGNRPDASLRQLFLCWHPQTEASLQKRFAVLNMLRTSVPDPAWTLMLALLPRDHDVSSNHGPARWRDWGHEPPRVTHGEYARGVREVIALILDDVGDRGDRWAALIPHFEQLSREDAVKAIGRLRALPVDSFDASARETIRRALRESVSRHRSHPDATWELTPEDVEVMVEIHNAFAPAEPLGRYGWLFTNTQPALLEGREVDWEEHAKLLRDHRVSAVRAIADAGGIPAVVEFAGGVENAFEVGVVLGVTTLADSEIASLLTRHLAAEDASLSLFARGLACEGAHRRGRTWAEELLRNEGPSWTPEQRAEFLLCFAVQEDATFALVDAQDDATQRAYWARVGPWGMPESRMEYTIRNLIRGGRPYFAADYLASYVHSRSKPTPRAALIADTLDAVLQSAPTATDPIPQNFGYDLGKLVETLAADPADVPLPRIAGIEWALVPLLSNHHLQPRILHGELGRDPAFFVELVTLVYRGKNEEPKEFSKDDQLRARAAHKLLESWHTLPGTRPDGSIDPAALMTWVTDTRAQLAAADRTEIGDLRVGEVLGAGPMGDDGLWPHEAVRAVLEQVESPEIVRGAALEVYNSRGVVSKDLDEGGAQERELVERYRAYARAMEDEWPNTAGLLRDIASFYEHDATRSDTAVELRHHLEH